MWLQLYLRGWQGQQSEQRTSSCWCVLSGGDVLQSVPQVVSSAFYSCCQQQPCCRGRTAGEALRLGVGVGRGGGKFSSVLQLDSTFDRAVLVR